MTAKRKETGAAYLRVGTTIYKRVQQPLSSGRSIEILLFPTTRTTGGRSTAF